ncbi:MAG: 3'-5' exonuclease [Nitrospirae bacterium]|nr:3'-5' exonuclease [Nitrospirota bacterium]
MLNLFRKFGGGLLASSGVDMSMPLDVAPYVVMDTELTGLDFRRDSIVSVGALRMTGTKIELSRPFYEVVRPSTALTTKSIVIHEITPSETEQKPGIEGIMEGFLSFCEGAMIVGHFISLDLRFLAKEMKRIGFAPLKNPAVDTCVMHEWMSQNRGDLSNSYFNGMESKDLFSLAKKFHVPVQGAHNALMDAYVTAQLFQRFITMLIKLGVRTLRDLLRIGKP